MKSFKSKFKKATAAILAATMIMSFSAVSFATNAAEIIDVPEASAISGDFEYSVLEDGTAEITGYTGFSAELVIPSEINGYKVKSIGDDAFRECSELTNVTIPDTVTEIGSSAFESCTNLSEITIPDSVTDIYGYAFFRCTSLENIIISDNINKVGFCSFNSTAWYDSQPDGLVYIGNVAYRYKGIIPQNTVIKIKDTTKCIADYAFEEQKCRFRVEIPQGVKEIGFAAFAESSGLKEVTLSEGVEVIGARAFEGCFRLERINIPNSVTQIGTEAFTRCKSLTKINIPENVTSIGDYAFYYCPNIKSVTIPANVTSIGKAAFGYTLDDSNYGWKIIEDFIIEGYQGTEAELYAKDNGLKFVTLKEDDACDDNSDGIDNYEYTVLEDGTVEIVRYVGEDYAIVIPDKIKGRTVSAIAEKAFDCCYNLVRITIPASVKSIGEYAFGYYHFGDEYILMQGFTIYSKAGSFAEKYAVEKGFEFRALNDEGEVYVKNDMNNDSVVDVKDVTSLQMHLANYGNEVSTNALDVNSDEKVDVSDATTLQMILAGYDL